MSGPCTAWASVDDAQSIPALADVDTDLLQTALTFSSEVLYGLSGRQFAGECSDVVRPARRELIDYSLPSWWSYGRWWDNPPSGMNETPFAITLGSYPIREITEVRIDGAALDPSEYRLDNRRWLIRLNAGAWPTWQNLYADPATEPNTFQVSFTWGEDPPLGGSEACKLLAKELVLAELNPDESNLPQRVTQLITQGATFALLDPFVFIDLGKTGIYLVDLWLHLVNPDKLKRRTRVFSVDRPRPVRRVG